MNYSLQLQATESSHDIQWRPALSVHSPQTLHYLVKNTLCIVVIVMY